jgi:hypothetical protein
MTVTTFATSAISLRSFLVGRREYLLSGQWSQRWDLRAHRRPWIRIQRLFRRGLRLGRRLGVGGWDGLFSAEAHR